MQRVYDPLITYCLSAKALLALTSLQLFLESLSSICSWWITSLIRWLVFFSQLGLLRWAFALTACSSHSDYSLRSTFKLQSAAHIQITA